MEKVHLPDESATAAWAASMASKFQPGDIVLLSGPLGAGKTTWVRAYLHALGYLGPVRSPTYNLIQTFDTLPPVMHADLYRLKGSMGIGLEDYLDTHVCLIEWPDRAYDMIRPEDCWQLTIDFKDESRVASLRSPFEPEVAFEGR